MQYAYPTFKDDARQSIYTRVSANNGSFVNVEWREITQDMPVFYKDYNSLLNLANAVGALYPEGELNGSVDNIATTCIKSFVSQEVISGFEQYGTVLTIVNTPSSTYNRIQLAFSASTGKVKYRVRQGADWLEWLAIN